jgi:hypothetical protein
LGVAAGGVHAGGHAAIVVDRIQVDGDRNLTHVRCVHGFLAGFLGARKDREQNRRQDRDDRDDDQEFN